MTESLWDVSPAEPRVRPAGPSPVPGGGSVAAVTAASVAATEGPLSAVAAHVRIDSTPEESR